QPIIRPQPIIRHQPIIGPQPILRPQPLESDCGAIHGDGTLAQKRPSYTFFETWNFFCGNTIHTRTADLRDN
ncbi:hypothetical protein DPEC_G00298020, partial [Dallia pectoralis]